MVFFSPKFSPETIYQHMYISICSVAHLETTLTLHTEHVGVGCDRDTYRFTYHHITYVLRACPIPLPLFHRHIYLLSLSLSPSILESQLLYERLSLEYLILSLESLRNTFTFTVVALQASERCVGLQALLWSCFPPRPIRPPGSMTLR